MSVPGPDLCIGMTSQTRPEIWFQPLLVSYQRPLMLTREEWATGRRYESLSARGRPPTPRAYQRHSTRSLYRGPRLAIRLRSECQAGDFIAQRTRKDHEAPPSVPLSVPDGVATAKLRGPQWSSDCLREKIKGRRNEPRDLRSPSWPGNQSLSMTRAASFRRAVLLERIRFRERLVRIA
jgi:hypothetical protein